MADGIAITTGSMKTIWTEEVGTAGSYHAQVMKLADGTAEGYQLIAGGSDYGLYSDVRRIVAGSIGKASIDQTTHGTTNRVAVHGGWTDSETPTISTAAYTAKDAVGGKLTFDSSTRVSAGKGEVRSVTIIDLDNEKAELVLWLFDRDFTATADAAPFDPSDADLANSVGIVHIPVANYYSANDNAVATVGDVGLGYKLTGTAMYGQLQCVATPTYSASTDLTVKLSVAYFD